MPDQVTEYKSTGYLWPTLLGLFLLVSALLLLYRITEFPPYFFCDEAIHGLEARSLIVSGRDSSNVPWPLLFRANGNYQLSLSIYLHIPFQMLLASDELSVRAVGVIAGMMMGLAAALLLKKLESDGQFSCLTPLLIVTSPFFFLHFRTAFEFIPAVAAWIWLILLFDHAFAEESKPSWEVVLMAAISAALSFYFYTPARGWIALSLIILVGTYFHLLKKRWRMGLTFLGVFFLLISPYLYTAAAQPEIAFGRLKGLGVSLSPDGISERLGNMPKLFIQIMDPRYWSFSAQAPEFESLERHSIPGRPLLPVWVMIFLPVGICSLLAACRRSHLARAFLLLLPVGAFPAVFVELSPLRCAPVGALYLLISGHGMFQVINALGRRLRAQKLTLIIVAAALGVYSVCFTQAVLNQERFDYKNYGFYGTQSGSSEVFEWIWAHQKSGEKILLASTSFNEPITLARFYFGEEWWKFMQIGEVRRPCFLSGPGDSGVWIIRDEDYQEFLRTKCPVRAEPRDIIKGINGKALFHIVALRFPGP